MSRETFTLTIVDASGPNEPAVAIRLRRLLKHLLRALAFRCKAIVEGDATAEVQRLRRLVESLAGRVAGQSEQLTARAERHCRVCAARSDMPTTMVDMREGRRMKTIKATPDAALAEQLAVLTGHLDRIAVAVIGMKDEDLLRLAGQLRPLADKLASLPTPAGGDGDGDGGRAASRPRAS